MTQLSNAAYKFVRTDKGLYYTNLDMNVYHKEMVPKGETPLGAGTIGVNDREWYILNRWSMTLKLGLSVECEEAITKDLGKPKRKEFWE